MTIYGECKLCKNKKDLQLSHAIGDSIFKKILRANSGKAISITSDDEPIGYTSDSWAEYQLCSDCEMLLNDRYESYSLGVLRARNCKISKSSLGVTFSNVDQHKLIMYFLSIFWRAANSGHRSYNNVRILKNDNEYLRDAILSDYKIPANKFTVQISRVIDLTKNRGFSDKNLKDIIISPFCRVYETKISACFMFEGFFVEIFMRGYSRKDRNKYGVLSKAKRIFVAPYINLFEIPEIVDLMVDGLGKHIDGKSRIKNKL